MGHHLRTCGKPCRAGRICQGGTPILKKTRTPVLVADIWIAITILFLSLPGPCLSHWICGSAPRGHADLLSFRTRTVSQKARPKTQVQHLSSFSFWDSVRACMCACVGLGLVLGGGEAGCGGRRVGIITPHRISCEDHILISLWTWVTPKKKNFLSFCWSKPSIFGSTQCPRTWGRLSWSPFCLTRPLLYLHIGEIEYTHSDCEMPFIVFSELLFRCGQEVLGSISQPYHSARHAPK